MSCHTTGIKYELSPIHSVWEASFRQRTHHPLKCDLVIRYVENVYLESKNCLCVDYFDWLRKDSVWVNINPWYLYRGIGLTSTVSLDEVSVCNQSKRDFSQKMQPRLSKLIIVNLERATLVLTNGLQLRWAYPFQGIVVDVALRLIHIVILDIHIYSEKLSFKYCVLIRW